MANTVLLKSPLHEAARQAGAHFMELAGWEIADHYGDPVREHLAVREAVGLIDLSHRGKIRVTGEDRIPFLHAMLSNDVKKLNEGEGLYAAMLNAQARVLADLYLYKFRDHFLIDSSALLTRKIVETLQLYIIMEKVCLEDQTSTFAFFALEGPKAASLLSKIFPAPHPPPEPNSHSTHSLEGIPVEIIRCSLSGEEGFALLTPRECARGVWDRIFSAGASFGLRTFGRAAANTLRLEAGIPWYGVDMDESNLLPETGLEHAVSYSKGCYIGQEVVARLQTYAKVTKKLMGLEMESREMPEKGTPLAKDGKEAGYLTSAAYAPTLKRVIGLAYLNWTFAAAGTKVEIQAGGKSIQARVTALPILSRTRT